MTNDPEKRKLLTMNDINNSKRVAIIDGRISISFFFLKPQIAFFENHRIRFEDDDDESSLDFIFREINLINQSRKKNCRSN